jgi:hypothetical protein
VGKKSARPYLKSKIKQRKGLGSVTGVVVHKCKALSSNPSTAKKQANRQTSKEVLEFCCSGFLSADESLVE